MRGLGDLIAWVLQPLEPLIRRFYGKKGCGCKKRQETLNKAFPNPLHANGGKPIRKPVSLTEEEIAHIRERRNRKTPVNKNLLEKL